MWKVTIKGILSHKVRFLLTGVAVVLGVAFISGTLVLTASMTKTFDDLFADIYRDTDAVVQGKAKFDSDFGAARGLVDASLLPEVRETEGVARAAGFVQSDFAVIIDKKGDALRFGQGPPNLGGNWVNDRDLNPFRIATGRPPRADNEIVIDKASAEDTGYKIGDQVPVQAEKGLGTYELVGTVTFGEEDSALGSTAVFFTTEKATELFGQPGKLNQIGVRADPGVSQEEVKRNLERALEGTPDIEVLTGEEVAEENQSDIQQALSFFNTFLLVFGVVALLVGSFVIFNTFSIIVAQRGREMALLRAIGARGGQVVRSVLLEAFFVGVVAAAIGFVGGVLLAMGVQALLSAVGLDLPANEIVVPPNAVIASFAVGIIVTVVAAVFPAVRAARIPPIAALQSISVDRSGTSVRRAVIGILVAVVGIVLLMTGLQGNGNLLSVGLGALVIFFGIAILGPVLARPISSVLGAPIHALKGITGQVARENAKRNPKRTSATAAALMIGVALVGLITVFGASARASVSDALDKSMRADYIVTSGGFGPGALPLALEDQLRELPEVETVSGVQFGVAEVDGGVTQLIAVDPAVVDQLFDLEISSGSLADLGTEQIAVQEQKAEDKGWKIGDRVKVQFPSGGEQRFTIAALFDQTAVGSYVISTEAYKQSYPQVFDAQIYMTTEGGPTAANRAAVEKVTDQYPTAKLQDQGEFKAMQSAQIDGFLNFVYILLAFAVIIALFGIANTLGLSIIERTHEIGLMRAVGMSRRQVRSSVRWESVIIALMGAFLGIVIGVFFAWALVSALRTEGIEVFALAPVRLVVIFVIAAIFGVLVAILPARRAARLDVLKAISTE